NIVSRVGMSEYADAGFIPYSVTNAGIVNFTAGLAKELEKEGIRVNAVVPTVTDTDRFRNTFSEDDKKFIIRKGKLGTPEEVADLVISLVKDKKATGKILIDKRVYL